MTEQLKPCPFCGNESPRISRRQDESLFSHATVTWERVVCDQCDCCTRSFCEGEESTAAQVWNTRTLTQRPAAQEVAAVKTLETLGYTYHGGELWKPPLGKRPAAQAGEPVASIYITPNGDREFDDWKCALPVGRNILYHRPAPGVPEGWRMDREGDDAIVVQHPAVGIARAINPAMSMEGQVLFMLCDDILQDNQSLAAAAQAKGGAT